ncbi:DNA-binding transcriptional activator DevR/DosR [Thermoflexales bacterium]|nr:DNA-binding transcriptional activator DevR/DosR [Thermoflexales bacterium]
MSRIRILIVDDHEVVRLGLRILFEDDPELEVVAEAGDAQQALLEAERHRPQVAIVDINLPGRSGLEVCREIRQRYPETRVVMLTSFADDDFIVAALRAGASGYVLKQVGGGELVRAVQAAARGETALDPQTAARVVARLRDLESKAEADAFRRLSPREREVLVLVTTGQSNKAIGAELNLSEITVRNYISNMLEKLSLNNRVELAAYAMQHHLNQPGREQ